MLEKRDKASEMKKRRETRMRQKDERRDRGKSEIERRPEMRQKRDESIRERNEMEVENATKRRQLMRRKTR
ncbi:PREDICTED: DEAD-box ATP-dependent RNA helicase 42-like [Trachymyrmex cornetzi]|uniref:DEAD-box ATP-dependent RNA helicase 42-like n=1 Tax=Trachymyrmex cornetzi TaxID=471704 RepID=UPI00084F4EF1|nr:PREDICTED: DEAD-box ATP-dependent RNA helicase 42-like [Trachymyrmex cornetzi]